jgi:hypothetical protein
MRPTTKLILLIDIARSVVLKEDLGCKAVLTRDPACSLVDGAEKPAHYRAVHHPENAYVRVILDRNL